MNNIHYHFTYKKCGNKENLINYDSVCLKSISEHEFFVLFQKMKIIRLFVLFNIKKFTKQWINESRVYFLTQNSRQHLVELNF